MRIRAAVGLALTIIVLKLLAPNVYSGIEGTVVGFLNVTQTLFAQANTVIDHGVDLNGF